MEDVHLCYLRQSWTLEDELWISHSLADPKSYPTACLAIRTLATAYYGKRYRQPDIVLDANHSYGRALITLQSALLKQDKSCIFDILAASTALQRYEVIVYTTRTGWILHAGGIARAIELSGPKCFERNPNKAILDANAYHIIQEAYHRRRRTFLALQEWRNLRTISGDQDIHFDRLQDFYARLAGLTERVTCFVADQDSWQHREILDEANLLLEDLDMWVNHWTAAFRFRLVERRNTSSTQSIYNDAKGPVFGSSHHYSSPLAGIGANIYRAIKLTVLEWRHKLLNPSWWPGEDHERMSEIPDVHQLAVDICRTLNVHFGEGGQDLCRVWYLLFCSVVAYKSLYRRSREARWITATLTDVGDRWGLELARNLTGRYSVKWRVEGSSEAR